MLIILREEKAKLVHLTSIMKEEYRLVILAKMFLAFLDGSDVIVIESKLNVTPKTVMK
jgi:hypothetical protein